MSQVFTFTGRKSELNINFSPPIELEEGKDYVLGLVDFQTYNNIPNVDHTNNKFYYGNNKKIEIPIGMYEIDDINRFIRIKLGIEYMDSEEYFFQLLQKYDEKDKKTKIYNEDIFFNITPNVNTLKCNLICSQEIDFTHNDSIGSLLGFNKRKLEPNVIHESDKSVDIFKINVLRIDCSIVSGSFNNGVPSHTIHEFFPSVAPGYKIIEVPSTIVYLPINTETINNILIRIVDQENKLVNFRNEEITLRLHLKSL